MSLDHSAVHLFPSIVGFSVYIFDFYSVAQAYVNQKKLDTETKILQANVNQFAKQTTQWLKLVEDFNQALKVGLQNCFPAVCIMFLTFCIHQQPAGSLPSHFKM
jgi:GCN5-like protein 1 (GCN5L1)